MEMNDNNLVFTFAVVAQRAGMVTLYPKDIKKLLFEITLWVPAQPPLHHFPSPAGDPSKLIAAFLNRG